MNPIPIETVPVRVEIAAHRLGVPTAWLRREVEEGRLPGLVAGRSVLVHLPTITALLAERAKGTNGGAA